MRFKALLALALLLVSCILLVGCKKESVPKSTQPSELTSAPPSKVEEAKPTPEAAEPSEADEAVTPGKAVEEAAPAEEVEVVAVLDTTKGQIVIELYPDSAPETVANFKKLIRKKFYDGLTFHRYVEGFVIQGGDPVGDGTGGPGYTIKDEFNQRKHVAGTVAMAKTDAPNSAGSQFYICLAPSPYLDGNYTVFGQVIQGMDNVFKLRQGDKMTKVTLEDKSKYVKE
jgi:cyclophilin family peptidyl-prolyl cis-trans isomerase